MKRFRSPQVALQLETITLAAFLGLLFWAALTPSIMQAQPALSAEAQLEMKEREIDKRNMLAIYDAIQAYSRDNNAQLPNWLADLFPRYLDDQSILVSPLERRTGKSVLFGNDDKYHTSYSYEFNARPNPERRDPDTGEELTMQEWKRIQMQEYGPAVPILRCAIHDPVLNVSFAGDFYETELFWEKAPETIELRKKYGFEPGNERGIKTQMPVRLVDAKTRQPLANTEFEFIYRDEFGYHTAQKVSTGDDGEAVIPMEGNHIIHLEFRIVAEGYAPSLTSWDEFRREIVPKHTEIRLHRPVTIGGRIENAAGEALANATVRVQFVRVVSQYQSDVMDYDKAVTDATGRWSLESVPPDFSNLFLIVSREGYDNSPISFTRISSSELRSQSAVVRVNHANP